VPQQAPPSEPAPSSAKGSQEQKRPLQNLVDAMSILQSIATIGGIIAAGVWFFVQGEADPKINITHSIIHKKLNSEQTWIRASVDIANIGKRRITLGFGNIKLYEIYPLDI
jgi:hypothetical protein